MKIYSGEIEYLNQKLNVISLPEISQSLIDRFLYVFDEIDKNNYTEGIKSKGCKNRSFYSQNYLGF